MIVTPLTIGALVKLIEPGLDITRTESDETAQSEPKASGRLPHVTLPIQRGSRDADRLARRGSADRWRELFHRLHQSCPSVSGVFRGIPKISETFFWTSITVSACLSLCESR